MPALHQLLCAHIYDIIAIAETWLKQQYANSLSAPDGHYHVIRCDGEGKAGGGVCLRIKREINILNIDIIAGVETVCIDIAANSNRYSIIILFRPPGYSTACFDYSVRMLPCLETRLNS